MQLSMWLQRTPSSTGASLSLMLVMSSSCLLFVRIKFCIINVTGKIYKKLPFELIINLLLQFYTVTLLLRGGHFAFMPLYRLMMHGGLIVYSAHYVYTLQSMREAAKSALYDPVNASMALTMDMLNLFGRLTFLVPPHFSVSNDHLFVMLRGRPAVISVINKPTGNNTNNNGLKPGKES